MADVSSMNAIALGNARRQQVREMNERIQQHNNDVANQISQIKDQILSQCIFFPNLQQTGNCYYKEYQLGMWPLMIQCFNLRIQTFLLEV